MTTTRPEDCRNHADALAETLQEFVWIHSGSDNGIGLQRAFEDALYVLREYRKAFEPAKVKPLKKILEEAYWGSEELLRDPWEAVLDALVEHAARWENYASDDRTTTEDIQAWLRAEAVRPPA